MSFGKIVERSRALVAAFDRLGQTVQNDRDVIAQVRRRYAARARQHRGTRQPLVEDRLFVLTYECRKRVHGAPHVEPPPECLQFPSARVYCIRFKSDSKPDCVAGLRSRRRRANRSPDDGATSVAKDDNSWFSP